MKKARQLFNFFVRCYPPGSVLPSSTVPYSMTRGKHRQRIFSPRTPPAKVEQLIAWPRREKIKTQGEKMKTQGEKMKTQGKK